MSILKETSMKTITSTIEWDKMGHQEYNGSPTFLEESERRILAVMMIKEGSDGIVAYFRKSA